MNGGSSPAGAAYPVWRVLAGGPDDAELVEPPLRFGGAEPPHADRGELGPGGAVQRKRSVRA